MECSGKQAMCLHWLHHKLWRIEDIQIPEALQHHKHSHENQVDISNKVKI